MTVCFKVLLIGCVLITMFMLVFVMLNKKVLDKLNALFVINTNVVMLIMTTGFIDGRKDMYIDIAISYAVLGFISTVILAKYIGGRRR